MGDVSMPEFADKLSEMMPVISREFLRHQTAEFYKMKITPPQMIILELLHKLDESKMTDLAHVLNVTTAAMTGIISRLVRDGYAVRVSEPDDRRIIKIRLTAKGANTVKSMTEHRKKMMIKIFGMISQEEREEYLNILSHVYEHLKEEER